MEDLLRELLNALDAVGTTNPEIYDSVCREHMGEPIFYLFIKPTPEYTMPDEFGLWDDNGNASVKQALGRYVESAQALAAERGLVTFHERLGAFQNDEVQSELEGNHCDDFFG